MHYEASIVAGTYMQVCSSITRCFVLVIGCQKMWGLMFYSKCNLVQELTTCLAETEGLCVFSRRS
jgi:hypothetical protein